MKQKQFGIKCKSNVFVDDEQKNTISLEINNIALKPVWYSIYSIDYIEIIQ